jgi:toxin FitB
VSGGALLDTNIPSELMRSAPEQKVQDWLAAQDIHTVFLSVVSLDEMESGFAILRDAARRARLEASLARHLAHLFSGRVLPVTQSIAVRWGRLDGMRRTAGQPSVRLTASSPPTALEHNLSLVTRNVKDFADLGITVVNPWFGSAGADLSR